MDAWIGFVGLCLSIISSAIGVGYKLGQIETRLIGIDKYLAAGAKRMDAHDKQLGQHETRLVQIETRLEGA